MAKKSDVNPFAADAAKRQAEQDALKRGLERDAAAGTEQAADEAPRRKLTLAISDSDKIKLKYAAAKRNMTVAALVHEWIETLDV